MEDGSASPASRPRVSVQSSITAQSDGTVCAPQIAGCRTRDIKINIYNQSAAEPRPQTPCEAPRAAPDVIFRVSTKLKSNLREKFKTIFEGIAKRGSPALLREVYTELYVTVGETEGVNKEHEVWQIDPAFKTLPEQDVPINCNDIFKPCDHLEGSIEEQKTKSTKHVGRKIRTVLTKGVAGIGKTVSVQKFILDWAEGEANQDIDLLFVLPFRELNSIINEKCSLHELLLDFHSELKELKDAEYYDHCKALFIFDGLDESKLPFAFNRKRVSNVSKSASLDELITNIIQGNLLPSAFVWITSRPAAIDNIPQDLIHRMTEVRGFTASQKEAYFRNRISSQSLANRIILHVKSVKSLEIMCHIPVFCWIIATVLEKMLIKRCERIPSSLTEMYTRFLLIQTNEKKKKYHGVTERDPSRLSDADVEVILKLGRLAFEQLMKRNIVFSEDDLRDYGIDITEASVRSGVFTEIVREEDPMFSVKKYSFVHLSFQEYLAAFFVYHTFAVKGVSLMAETQTIPRHVTEPTYILPRYQNEFRLMQKSAATAAAADDDDGDEDYAYDYDFSTYFDLIEMVRQKNLTLHDLQKNAIQIAMKSRSGHLDLFLRFLLGLSVESNFLKSISLKVKNLQKNIDQTKQHIKSLFRETYKRKSPSSGRCINLFHCLLELDDHSMAEEIQRFLTTEKQSESRLTAAQCSTMAYIILMSKEALEELDLNKFCATQAGCRRLVPAVRNCRKAVLAGCRLKEQCLKTVASALQDPDASLRELDLSRNPDLALFLYSLKPGLDSPHCRLESLNLSHIDLYISGASVLRAVLLGPHPQPHTLKLFACYIFDKSAEILFSAFQSSACQLKELDISYNSLTVTGVERVLQGLRSPSCRLEVLRLSGSEVSAASCAHLASALKRSRLRELILDNCDIRDVGVKHLCAGLTSTDCQLQTLGLSGCVISEEGCRGLASALSSKPSSVLRDLDLSYNHPGDEGEKRLSELLRDPCCKLHTLRLDHGGKSRLTAGLWKYYQELNIDRTDNVICSSDRKGVSRNPGTGYLSVWDMGTSELTLGKARCREELKDGRFYFEVQWAGSVIIALKEEEDSGKSLVIDLDKDEYNAYYAGETCVRMHLGKCLASNTLGVYLDCPGGTVSLYRIHSGGMKHFYMFNITFNEPVTPEFWIEEPMDDVSSVTIVDPTKQLHQSEVMSRKEKKKKRRDKKKKK